MNINEYKISQKKYSNLEILIAKLYLHLLPIRMISQLLFLRNLLPGATGYFDFILHFMGVCLLILNSKRNKTIQKDTTSRLANYFYTMIIFLNISSFVMAIVIQATYGNYASESAFDGITGMVIYFFQYALMIFYNKNIFQMMSKEEILKIIQRVCVFLLILGYWQIAILNFGGIYRTLLDSVDIFNILYPTHPMPKLSLTGSEGASAGNLVGIFVFPFLCSMALTNEKKTKFFIQMLLWLPAVYFTQSTTAYILITIDFAVYLMILVKDFREKKLAIIGFLSILSLIFLLFYEPLLSILPIEVRDQIQYLLIEKSTDLENGSTISRTIPLLVNWGAFTEYPIFGVGNGLQGYFFIKYFPSWAYNAKGSDIMKFYQISQTQISNGSLFFPSLLSGYGIIGIVLIIIYIIKSNKLISLCKQQLGAFYYYYIIACFAILFSGFQTDFTGQYFTWFVLSIPYMTGNFIEKRLNDDFFKNKFNWYSDTY